MRILHLLSVWLLLLGFFQVNAQVVFCPTNVDFESGNFDNWFLYRGVCCPITTPTLGGPVSGRHVITSGSNLDYYGQFPTVAPSSGLYSLKLGNNNTNSEAERARYYVRVPNDQNNYSLFLRYAVVLEDPGHTAADQPRFEVKGYDSLTGAPLSCVQFNFVAASSLPGFTISPVDPNVIYKDWSIASLDLSGMAGRTLAIDFASGDCDLGAHFGYGYVDLNCGLFQISSTVCSWDPVSKLTAPPGFQRYEWYDSTFTHLLDSNRILNMATPPKNSKFYVVLKPFPGFGCIDTLSTRILVSDLTVKVNTDTIVCNNISVQLNDSANASASFLPLTYKWTPPDGLSCTTCLNPIASPSKTTKYKLEVTDATGCAKTDSFQVVVRLYLAGAPQSIIECLGTSGKLKVIPGGFGPFTFQWYRNGTLLSGETKDSLLFPSMGYTDTASYFVVVKGQCDSLISPVATVKIHTDLLLVTQPQSFHRCAGTKIVLRGKVSGTGTILYQWYRKGVLLPGATKDSLVINNLSTADTGYYVLKIMGPCDSTQTDTVYLSTEQTKITLQPIGVTQCKGTPVILKAAATGIGPLTYQWRKNGNNIFGATRDSLVLNNIQSADVANYTVVVSGACNTVTSAVARVTIPFAVITTQPTNIAACWKTKVVLKVVVANALNYQWFRNGLEMTGETDDSLIFNSIDFPDTVNYSVKIFGICDTVVSNVVKLFIFEAPQITVQPVGTTACVRSAYTLRAKAVNPYPMSFQWWKNGKKIAGATRDSLVFLSLTPADSGYYFWVAKTGCDSVISDTAWIKIRYVKIQSQPISDTSCLSHDVNFRVKVYSIDTLFYQWEKSGSPLATGIADTFTIQNVSYADTALYTVRITSACDTVVSSSVRLAIFPPTRITLQPQDITQCHFTKAVFKTRGTGTGPVSYQWYKNGLLMSGETRDSLIIQNITHADTVNRFTVSVKSFCDSIISSPVKINVYAIPDPGLPDSTLLCVNIGYIEVNGFIQYLWNTGSSSNRIAILTDGYYTVKVTDNHLCANSDTTYVKLKALPSVFAGNDTILCNEVSLPLNGIASNYDSIVWVQNSAGVFSNEQNTTTVFIPHTGEVGLTNIELFARNGCGVITDTLNLTLKNRTSSAFVPSDTVVCEGSSPVELVPLNSGGLFYGPFMDTAFFNPVHFGLYTVQYKISENGCTDSSEKQIRVVPMPVSSFKTGTTNPNIDSAILFIPKSEQTLNYVWYFANGDSSDLDTLRYQYAREGNYKVMLVSINEICTDTFSLTLLVEGSENVWTPNVFTPNGDRVNDVFKVVYLNSKGGVLSIYNRWGDKVYTSNDLTQGWDGTFEGQPCQSDVYVYVVDYNANDDRTKQVKGNVTLLR